MLSVEYTNNILNNADKWGDLSGFGMSPLNVSLSKDSLLSTNL